MQLLWSSSEFFRRWEKMSYVILKLKIRHYNKLYNHKLSTDKWMRLWMQLQKRERLLYVVGVNNFLCFLLFHLDLRIWITLTFNVGSFQSKINEFIFQAWIILQWMRWYFDKKYRLEVLYSQYQQQLNKDIID